MRIGGSTIAMTSQRKYSEYKSIQYAEYNGLINERVSVDPEGKEKSLFDQIKDAAEQKNMKDLTDKTSRTRGTIVTSEGYKSLKSIRELRMALLENIINAFARRNGGGTELTYAPLQQSGGSTTYIRQTVESGFYKEEENTAFVSEGKVITKDGREINFNVSFEMSRSFQASYEAYSESTYVLCDPLVFNFEGNTADITDQKFMFDLDCEAKRRKFLLLEKAAASLPLIKTATALSMTEQSFSEQRAVTVLQTLQNMMKTVTAGLTRMTGYSHNLESGRRTKKERMSLFPLRMQGSEQSIFQAFQPLSATLIILTIQWLLYKRQVFFSTKTEMQAQYSM